MDAKRKICVVTGTRAEYGILRSLLDALRARDDLEYGLLVTGMHLSPEFGSTIHEIMKDPHPIWARVDMLLSSDTPGAQAKGLGLGIHGMAQTFESLQPDIVVVLGDRDEPLAAVMAAAHMNICVAHLHGGEVSGTIDESIRHAITKFSHLHFPATGRSADFIERLGERKDAIYLVGSCGVDNVKSRKLPGKKAWAEQYDFDTSQPILLAIQHPVTTEYEDAADNMETFMGALRELRLQTLFIRANADAGNAAMMTTARKILDQFQAQPFVRAYPNIPSEDYMATLKYADAMIGNSSSGLIEAPVFGLPYVLVGTRQDGRECGPSVLHVPNDKKKILDALDTALHDEAFKRRAQRGPHPYDPFNDANAGTRIAEILATVPIDGDLIQKQITYVQ
jgi:UDP-N-acetylglucosamine 2-epimerase (non-hydrolysing)/GDP/UDP-N,N'-diacetylbacillosamine 2-epimerase (hydrolysing)